MRAWRELAALPLVQLDECLKRMKIATPTQTGDLSDADGRDDRFVAEWFPCVYIRQMHLDDRAPGVLECITQAVTRMRQPSRVDHNAHDVFRLFLHAIDQRSLKVRLESDHLVALFSSACTQPFVDLR